MNRPKFKVLKLNLKNSMEILNKSSELKEHPKTRNVLMRIEETLDEIIITLKEIEEERGR